MSIEVMLTWDRNGKAHSKHFIALLVPVRQMF